MLSGSNSHGKYFHRNSNSYFEPCFLLDFIKNINDFHMFCLYYHAVFAHNHQVCFKKHEIFNEIEMKTWFKIWVEILMKMFSMWIAPGRHSWPLKVCAVVSEMIFPRKNTKISCFFMYADYCRVSYSKCMHCSSFTSTQWDHFFGRGRAVDLLACREFWIFLLAVFSYAPGMTYIHGI